MDHFKYSIPLLEGLDTMRASSYLRDEKRFCPGIENSNQVSYLKALHYSSPCWKQSFHDIALNYFIIPCHHILIFSCSGTRNHLFQEVHRSQMNCKETKQKIALYFACGFIYGTILIILITYSSSSLIQFERTVIYKLQWTTLIRTQMVLPLVIYKIMSGFRHVSWWVRW